MSTISETKRPIIVTPGGCFRLPGCCSISKLQCVRCDFGRKSRANFTHFNPFKFREGVGKTSVSVLQHHPRSKSVISLYFWRALLGRPSMRLQSGCQKTSVRVAQQCPGSLCLLHYPIERCSMYAFLAVAKFLV